ncbi:hypothetical protein BOX15_Mlig016042g1 [Macrostomum lignano]|uniref:RING-type domain-containing protein n=1 Tax=Macrostomum lignano TaxID=282301 RepID=A0A267EVN6_9PLAT|nr:hypothetical protein BOX15_Mlig016042g1 [Macrostomum lignano]
MTSSSRLVETVQLNFEDFSESFLTCGTCLTLFDSGEHQPKLLPCSHTLCRACLQRIVPNPASSSASSSAAAAAAAASTLGTFRCPICREGIAVPIGGAAAFPPSFVVNQLLDLMVSQRKDLVPKCSIHTGRELLFCETCDSVFCAACQSPEQGGHQNKPDHTVLSFSVAVKRTAEILLYKAHLATSQLSSAYETVSRECDRLDSAAESCILDVDESFQQLHELVERRHSAVRSLVRKLQDEKRRCLREQLGLIAQEKAKVERECEGLQYQMDVMAITKKISDLNGRLGNMVALSEPRENHYIAYKCKGSAEFNAIDSAISSFGSVLVSATYPGLCRLELLEPTATVNLTCRARLQAVDYHGRIRTGGGDPVTARLETPLGELLETAVEDAEDGTYLVRFVPLCAGRHRLTVRVFDRPVRGCPVELDVAGRHRPVAKVTAGSSGACQIERLQAPYAVASSLAGTEVFVSDTGNCRIAVLDSNLQWLGEIGKDTAASGRAATGLAVDAAGRLWVANWKERQVFELDPSQDRIVSTISGDFLAEPGLVAVGSRGEIVVGDAGSGQVHIVDPGSGCRVASIGNSSSSSRRLKSLTALTADWSNCADGGCSLVYGLASGEVTVCGGGDWAKIGDLRCQSSNGAVAGLAVDEFGRLLVARQPGVVQVYTRPLGEFICDILPEEQERLRRPGGVCCLPDGWLVVADTAGNTVKKFRYT